MEPRKTSPESAPLLPNAHEQAPATPEAVNIPATELTPGDHRNEQVERRLGQHVESVAAQPPQVTSLPAPVTQVQSDDDDTASASNDDTPLVAADEDLIEQEWVEKAKNIITSTRDDPYRREQEVKRLQIDYIKKRYGKSIGSVDSSAWGR
ncbi:hypothetical protein EOL96_05340 [Candidatus Saccharibacteria bacterium]|nr:hypothetical protein [Candidatus Saccharibacteria bacterium]